MPYRGNGRGSQSARATFVGMVTVMPALERGKKPELFLQLLVARRKRPPAPVATGGRVQKGTCECSHVPLLISTKQTRKPLASIASPFGAPFIRRYPFSNPCCLLRQRSTSQIQRSLGCHSSLPKMKSSKSIMTNFIFTPPEFIITVYSGEARIMNAR